MPTLEQVQTSKTPLVALIGLPNSGKSTLLNRISGEKIAITAREEHTTRDLNYGEDFWEGMYVRFVDTGGLVPNPEDKIQKEIQIKSWSAISKADLLLWVIDRKQNPDTISQSMMERLWKTGKDFIIVINKVDDPNLDKDEADYAQFGPLDFINVSAVNGYGLGNMMDMVVDYLEKKGFQKTVIEEGIVDQPKTKKRKRDTKQDVNFDAEGKIFLTREEDEEGDKIFQLYESGEENKYSQTINNLVMDIFGVCVYGNDQKNLLDVTASLNLDKATMERLEPLIIKNQKTGKRLNNLKMGRPDFWDTFKRITGQTDDYRPIWEEIKNNNLTQNQEIYDFLFAQKERGLKIYYLTNVDQDSFEKVKKLPIFSLFDGGLTSFETKMEKPSLKLYQDLIKKYELEPSQTLYADDKKIMVNAGREVGMWAFKYKKDRTDLKDYLDRVEQGFEKRIPAPPKIVLLGKPNVGKSSIFNALCDEDIQIVTEIAGTTLSVNDYLLKQPQRDREYLLMDTTGIRKPGQRTFGVEDFATYRTIQAAQQADVVCVILDASQPISHQDQVVAGIVKEASKGLVIIANKSDLVDEEQKARFIKEFNSKFKFLKVDKFVWTSVTEYDKNKHKDKKAGNIDDIFYAIDYALHTATKTINQEEVRKLFNYLMKKRPPKKLRLQKRPVIYGLTFKHPSPPTFELTIKDKATIHWSYVRFLENILRKQFHLHSTGVVVKLKELPKRDRPKYT